MPRTYEIRPTLSQSDETPDAPDAEPTDHLIGAVVAERYRIQSLLGEGGIGRVYRALHVQLNH